MKTNSILETSQDLEDLLKAQSNPFDECVLRLYDNKSDVLLQTVVVKHPIIFIRGIQDFCKTVNLPVSDISVCLIGFISESCCFKGIDEIVEISPYVYFKKSEDSESSVQN